MEREDQPLDRAEKAAPAVSEARFNYDGIPLGYYDRVLREGSPIRRLWHVSKFERVFQSW